MTDYISREDALYFEMEIEADPDEIQAISKGMALYGEYIKSIPAADVVERKRGKWEEHGEPNEYGKYEVWYYACSFCGQVGLTLYNFCPYCGAEMESTDDV